jgi:DNA-binding transcriptional regulator YhcF (GntR family)
LHPVQGQKAQAKDGKANCSRYLGNEKGESVSGWISIHRKLRDHWLWDDPRKFSKAEAWIDLLMSANHAEAKIRLKGKLFTCNRGDTMQSLETIAERWKWSRQTVRRFLELLEKEGMIRYKNEQQLSRITICKYDTYQSSGVESEQQVSNTRALREQHVSTNNKNNKNKEEKIKKDLGFFEGIDLSSLPQYRITGEKKTLQELQRDARLAKQYGIDVIQ